MLIAFIHENGRQPWPDTMHNIKEGFSYMQTLHFVTFIIWLLEVASVQNRLMSFSTMEEAIRHYGTEIAAKNFFNTVRHSCHVQWVFS